jgi:uncharacterized membrane protein (UPF0127 family)
MPCRSRTSAAIAAVLLAALFLLAACRGKSYARMDAPMPASPGWSPSEPSRAVIHTADGAANFTIELADTPEERERGLMGRTSLASDAGMLFVFPKETHVTFWMKDTPIPLDMIFIRADMTVAGVAHAVPCEAEPCPTYPSGEPVQYVLEIGGGIAEEKHIKAGDTASLISI